ncbi:MAG: LysR family transcriptional regulator [Canibacter sp.]
MRVPQQSAPDLAALDALVLIANTGSISAASARLGISQQAVSLRLRNLETTIGSRLVVRTATGSHLTATGELVAGWAGPLLEASKTFSDAVAALRNQQGSTLTIAASLTIAEYLLPTWIASLRTRLSRKAPAVRLTAMNSVAVIAEVRNGAADVGFIETPAVPTDLTSVRFAQDTIEIVTARDHPWARRTQVTLAEVAATPLVLREPGSGTRQALENAFAREGMMSPAEPAEVASTTLAVRSAIMAGTAPGALSALAIADDVRAGRLARVTLDAEAITRPLTAVWSGKTLSPAAEQLLDVIRG